ncbi:hypothetical protein MNV49_002147 [Pseudohyphozyma bogoriensis]|nr:hypothetical protein MNV49_002147 [Pseudohyphozyma bogoriensis]
MAPASTETKTLKQVDDHLAVLQLRGAHGPTKAKYPRYLPVWEKSTNPPLVETPYVDPGSRGTADKRHLLLPGVKTRPLTPKLGTEITGVQLSKLTKEGLDDLGLLAAERGVLVFRGQDFKAETVRHFGRLHVHPTECHPTGYPDFRVVYRDPSDPSITDHLRYGGGRTETVSSIGWHVDHTAEIQPPGVTLQRLEGLQVLHDNSQQIANSRKENGPVRYEPVQVVHPLIRTHAVTGKKSINIHGFAQKIVGWKKEESDYLLGFLNDILTKSVDFQMRASYDDSTVVVWDNRLVSHTATRDWDGEERRHMIRVAAHADRPK